MKTTKIYGGPGCGKSTRLLKIMKDSAIPYEKIGYCTFSRKALHEMRARVLKDTSVFESDLIWFRTIHSMNFKLLGIRKEQVATNRLAEFCKEKGFRMSDDIIKSIKENTEDELLTFSVDRNSLDDIFFKQMNEDRQELRDFEFVHPRLKNYASQFIHFKKSYFDWMKEHDYIDFIGMIEEGIKQAVLPPVQLICIDEWQDLNPLQIKQINMWAANIETSYHAGDDDQCIHEWAGAKPSSFLDLQTDNEIILEESFRLPSDVLSLSQMIISKNTNRKNKNLYTHKDVGGIFVKNIADTCDFIKTLPRDETCYVLVRNNFLKSMVIKDLIHYGVPLNGLNHEKRAIRMMQEMTRDKKFLPEHISILCEGSIFPAARYFLRGSKAKLKKIDNSVMPSDGYTWEQMAQFGMTGDFFEDIYIGNLAHLNIPAEDRSYIVRLFKNYGYEFNTVSVMTIHQAKGLEADTVVLISDIAKAVYDGIKNPAEREPERRVWYTAITRTVKRLISVKNTNYSSYQYPIGNFIEVFCNGLKKTDI